MPRSVFTKDYRVFLRRLRAARKRAGLTQKQLAERLHQTQSFISKCERGERRLDVVELHDFCRAMGVSLSKFMNQLTKHIH